MFSPISVVRENPSRQLRHVRCWRVSGEVHTEFRNIDDGVKIGRKSGNILEGHLCDFSAVAFRLIDRLVNNAIMGSRSLRESAHAQTQRHC